MGRHWKKHLHEERASEDDRLDAIKSQRTVFHILFGEFKEGRLDRGKYLAYSVLATVLAAFAMLCIMLALGSVAGLVSGSTGAVEVIMRDGVKGPGGFILLLLGIAFVFVHSNLSAKRYRDMGLKGWKTLLGVSLLMSLISLILGPTISGILQALVFLGLVLIPANTFSARTPH